MRRERALTLVEVMVALTLSLLAMAVALAWLARGRLAWRGSESLIETQEALDAAAELLAGELRLAGYLGLASAGTPVEGATQAGSPEPAALAVSGGCASSLALDLARPVDSADGAYQVNATTPARCGASPAGRSQDGADTLTIRHASGEATPPAAGRLALESTLAAVRLVADGERRLGAQSGWHELEVGFYYVSRDSTAQRGRPSLRRKRLVGGSRPAFQDEELVTGIEDLQLELGLDADDDADQAVDRWVPAGTDYAGSTPRALRLWLLARSGVSEGQHIDLAALDYANRHWPAEQSRYRRQLASLVVQLRNGPEP